MPQRKGTRNALVIVLTPTAGKGTGSRKEARRPGGQAPLCPHRECLMQTWFPSVNQESLTGYPRHLAASLPA